MTTIRREQRQNKT